MQFYAKAALDGPTKDVELDNYDEDDNFEGEQPADAKVKGEDVNSEQPAEVRAEYEDFDSKQPTDIKMGSPFKNASDTVLYLLIRIFVL